MKIMEFYKGVVSDNISSTVCRCCLLKVQDETVSMLDVHIGENNFLQIWEECTAIKVATEDAFTHICRLCMDNTKQFYDFRIKCRKSDAFLKALLVEQDTITTDYVLPKEEEIEIRLETQPKRKEKSTARIKNKKDVITKNGYQESEKDIEASVIKKEVKSNQIEKPTAEVKEEALVRETDTEASQLPTHSETENNIKLETDSNEESQINDKDVKTLIDTEVSNCTLKEHLKLIAKYVCGQCENKFDTLRELTEHRKITSHLKRNKKMCKLCGKITGKLIEHMRIHTKEKPFACRHCNKPFSNGKNMTRHEKIHTGERPFICKTCGQGFIRKVSLIEHMGKHSKDSWYVCSYCGKSSRLYTTHKAHMLTHNPVGEKSFKEAQCDICNKVLSSKSGLRIHKQVHSENCHLCSECGKTFKTKPCLKNHMKCHTGVKPFSCAICGKRFAQQMALKLHNNVHTGHRPYTCTICSQSFKQSNHLKNHMSLHTGEKKHVCTFCSKAFRSKPNLTVHQRIHTGETPHVCDVCNKGFYNTTSLKRHKSKHTITGETEEKK